MRTLLLLLLLATPVQAQYPPESQPLPSPELVFQALGFVGFDTVPVEDIGDPVTVDFNCARLQGTIDQCAAGMARLQDTLNQSQLGHITVRLLSVMQSNYTSNGVISNDLTRTQNPSDGFADDIMVERNRVGADCTVVLTTAGDSCGIAYLLAGATSCVAVMSHGCLSNSSYEHEVGHNAGLTHDQPNSSSGGGYAGTSYGYCPNCGHKDVMVYPSPCPGSRIARYSNLNQFCPFHPTVPFGSATANGALAWLNRAPLMANFRNRHKASRPIGARVEPTL